MNVTEAYETYLNGNITDFKRWLKRASKSEIARVTYFWIKDDNPLLKLISYIKRHPKIWLQTMCPIWIHKQEFNTNPFLCAFYGIMGAFAIGIILI